MRNAFLRRTAWLVVGLGSLAIGAVAEAQTYTVTRLDGDCTGAADTLYWAFTQANSDGQPSLVEIDPALAGVIFLDCGLEVTEELFFNGTPNVVIDGSSTGTNIIHFHGPRAFHAFRHLYLHGGAGTRGLLIEDGHTVELDEAAIAYNDGPPAPYTNLGAGVLVREGRLSTYRTLFGKNRSPQWGGAIYFENGELDVRESLFHSNGAAVGAGVFAFGDIRSARIDQSLFYRNRATQGGAIHLQASSTGGAMTVVNSTFTENGEASSSSRGGAIDVSNFFWTTRQAIMTVLNSTFVCNSGFYGSTFAGTGPAGATPNLFRASNSIMTGCVGATTPICYGNPDYGGSYNVWNDTSCTGLGTIWTGSFPNTDPRVLPLADNGGFTATHALDPTSPAIGNGNPAICPPVDQRGVARTTCWMGAYEN
jgi:hypothetical protein